MRISDWSSDVCSSDLAGGVPGAGAHHLLPALLRGRHLEDGPPLRARRHADARDPAAVREGQGTRHRLLPRLCRVDRGGRSEEHTSELQSLMRISYAVFCLKKKNTRRSTQILLRNYNGTTTYTI